MVQQGDGTRYAAASLRGAGDDEPDEARKSVVTAGAPRTWGRRRRADLARELRVAGRAGGVLALLAALAAAWWSGASWATPAVVVVAAAGALLAVVDVRTHRLPDVIVVPTGAAVVALLAVASLAAGDGAPLVRALAGGALGFCAYAALRLAHPPGLGFGDVKLAGTLGTPLAWLGWAELVAGLLLPFLLGGAWALGLVVSRRARRDTAVAFGPFMVLGAGVAAGWGQTTTGAVLGG
ncbi:A24 family peptidase [Cellulosimicrobium sp. SL-1]|uniref:prepilin peptidase n=1 Tax=Cellulosimicrobium sp. SL-1 TaxID=2699423 RepID=UPI0013D5B07B|nr:A24 family peptidase [Cellulosimicrobium sp. SL-1]